MTLLPYAIDLVAIALLTFGLYVPRHRRRDLVVAYIGVNVGVLAVASVLAGTAVAAGLGLGLFGVLSIIRLRSTELDQQEVAYYFSALALGLIGGLAPAVTTAAALSALVLAAVWVGDHPRLLHRYRAHLLNLDRAFTDHGALLAHVEGLLGARVRAVRVVKVDQVLDTTLVEVRYEVPREAAAAARRHDRVEVAA